MSAHACNIVLKDAARRFFFFFFFFLCVGEGRGLFWCYIELSNIPTITLGSAHERRRSKLILMIYGFVEEKWYLKIEFLSHRARQSTCNNNYLTMILFPTGNQPPHPHCNGNVLTCNNAVFRVSSSGASPHPAQLTVKINNARPQRFVPHPKLFCNVLLDALWLLRIDATLFAGRLDHRMIAPPWPIELVTPA